MWERLSANLSPARRAINIPLSWLDFGQYITNWCSWLKFIKRYVWVASSAGMRFFFCKPRDDKNSLCKYQGCLKSFLLIFFYEHVGEFLCGMTKGRVTEQEMAEIFFSFLLKKSAFYGKAENILIFLQFWTKMIYFCSFLRLLREIRIFLPKSNHFAKAGQWKEWIAACYWQLHPSALLSTFCTSERQRCGELLIAAA